MFTWIIKPMHYIGTWYIYIYILITVRYCNISCCILSGTVDILSIGSWDLIPWCQWCFLISPVIQPGNGSGWWLSQPLWKICSSDLVSWGYYSQYMDNIHVPNHQAVLLWVFSLFNSASVPIPNAIQTMHSVEIVQKEW